MQEILEFILGDMFVKFGRKIYKQVIGIPITILEIEIFTHVLTNISGYISPIFKKLVTKLKPFKFASDLRKPHLSNSMRSKVI